MDSVVLFVFLLCISDSESMRTLKHVAVKSGESVTIPCFYNKSYESNKKYWCHGYSWSSCTIVSYANTYGSTSVIDHPTHNMFTVELNRLNTDHSGWYWCAAEIGDQSVLDDKDYLYLTVSAAPEVSVLGSRVSGEEGSSVSVQCLYSAAYQNKQKQWCRSTDWSCYTVGRTHTSQNLAVWIREGIRSFNVEMTGLKKSDAGWYWCSVGDVQVPVHLTVTDALTVTTTVTKTPDIKKTSIRDVNPHTTPVTPSENLKNTTNNDWTTAKYGTIMTVWLPVAVGLGLLVILVILTCTLKHRQTRKENLRGSSNTADTSSPVQIHTDVIYCSVTKVPKHETLSPTTTDDGVIYSSVLHK
ncbi:polymeric immunoglobulin receptor-like [Brachyhypopomus gauderio]|uniref:polymeric immunoglobulin receptor-like n=1 Tax=Brachyhypopomus gauderio TaxID=698409 RepID=UPI00404288FD